MTSPRGSLCIVGTGLRIAGQLTFEALSAIEQADKLFHLVQDIVTHRWLEERNPTAESLYDSYVEGRIRHETYGEIVQRILAPVRMGLRVCAAFYGHPGVFVKPAHDAIRLARAEGLGAEMLPGISAEDCLVADVGFDPGERGCQSFEATDFLVRHRRYDSSSALLLWQVGGIGVRDFRSTSFWNPKGVAVLADYLSNTYGAEHEVVLYEATVYPIGPPKIYRCSLSNLPEAPVTIASTLYVPPLSDRAKDEAMIASIS